MVPEPPGRVVPVVPGVVVGVVPGDVVVVVVVGETSPVLHVDGMVMVLASRVTAALRARTRPWTVAAVSSVAD